MGTLLLILHVILCFVLIVVVLLQTGKGAEIGATFGGGSHTLFGSRGAGNFLTKTTAVVGAAFMLTSLALAMMATDVTSGSVVREVPAGQAAPAAPAGQGQGGAPFATVPAQPAQPAPAQGGK